MMESRPQQDEPLLRLVGMAGLDHDSPGDLAARHDEYLVQGQVEDDKQDQAAPVGSPLSERKIESMVGRNFGRITIDPDVCHGKPCIAGTRILVTNVLSQLAGGYSIERIVEGYPELSREDVVAAIEYAVATVLDEDVLPLTYYRPSAPSTVTTGA